MKDNKLWNGIKPTLRKAVADGTVFFVVTSTITVYLIVKYLFPIIPKLLP